MIWLPDWLADGLDLMFDIVERCGCRYPSALDVLKFMMNACRKLHESVDVDG